ncbi:uncharacterized protein LOC126766956 [Bactrocera neohumeralis]|uniref:uncharacterized protein LOC126766956 n=1 Tax=Bactrocera neohumeralis TaxID=98809 RepID=UPI002165B312|nr:uncharacterized protein LOC126766956 [Bactrocera neohumeralis]
METFRERTLATRYQPRQRLPENFPEILKEYAREVLRAQPEDILAWSADYFRQLALETDPLQPQRPPSGHYAPVVEDEDSEILIQKMVKTFSAAAESTDGSIPASVADQLLRESFQLTPTQVLYIMTSTFSMVDEEGTLLIEPFCRGSARAIQYFQATGEDFSFTEEESENTTVHGLNRKDVEGDFFRMFRMLDEAQTGWLPFADYCNSLINAPYHLTQRDVRALCMQCERNENDEVNYEKERSRWFDLLRLTEQFELFDLNSSDDEDAEQ